MKPIVKVYSLPGFKFIHFFNTLGFGIADLDIGNSDNPGKKLMINFGTKEMGIYFAKKGGTHVKRDENPQSPTASA